jgi:hypothetical protein
LSSSAASLIVLASDINGQQQWVIFAMIDLLFWLNDRDPADPFTIVRTNNLNIAFVYLLNYFCERSVLTQRVVYCFLNSLRKINSTSRQAILSQQR